ncbi:alpha/beta hydrolase [Mycolicibacterium sp. 018/SC-01/001]|uniref:alpha/beta fold hydrolase n=1 Tax=Mycolicibacterium sp. 018/SC-01/001 TaxID=2592069 RepID=UPI00117C4C1A|nr:alpha/beta hydrolase [Mycolicibacterium sp. 018/SC-01/001]TRW79870.1 alpha/beta hydrolase [Mycolicibacterium sp. 018/SC-01/001]
MGERQVRAVDGFRLAYERTGTGHPVVLLHGWPGDRHDYRAVTDRLRDRADVIAPDLRGFGESDKHDVDPVEHYGVAAQARSVLALMDELDIGRAVLAGYDVGGRVAREIAERHPDRVGHLVLSPPLPGVGSRILAPDTHGEYWYQAFHQLPLIEDMIDGRPDVVHAYLSYFWNHWTAPEFTPDGAEIARLATLYATPGALVASIKYYRSGAGAVNTALHETPPERDARIATPTIVLWPGADALVRREWADHMQDYFAEVDVRVIDSGHFTPVEAPDDFVTAIVDAIEPMGAPGGVTRPGKRGLNVGGTRHERIWQR